MGAFATCLLTVAVVDEVAITPGPGYLRWPSDFPRVPERLPDQRRRVRVADITARQVLFAMAEVVRLGVPAGRKVRGKRGVDEPGDGCGVRAAGIPLQGERDELRWLDRPDNGCGVRCGEGRDEQDPRDVALVGPAGGGQFGIGEVNGGRADARYVEGLLLAQRPGGKQVSRSCTENIVSQVVQGDRVLTGQVVPGPQPDQKRLRAEHLVGYPLGVRNQAARYGNVYAPRDEGVGHRWEPHSLHVHGHMRRFDRELADQMRCKD